MDLLKEQGFLIEEGRPVAWAKRIAKNMQVVFNHWIGLFRLSGTEPINKLFQLNADLSLGMKAKMANPPVSDQSLRTSLLV